MFTELNLYDINADDEELKKIIYKNIDWGIDSISTHQYYINKIRQLTFPEFKISCPVDFPYGLSSYKIREQICIHLVRQKVSFIDLVINPTIVKNNERKDIIKEIKTIKNICFDNNIELRIMLDYRMFSDRNVFSTIELANCLGITHFIPSSGQFVDEVTDNIINCALIQNKFPGTKVILNTVFCNKTEYDHIQEFKIFGLKTKNFTHLDKKVYSNTSKE